VDVESGMVDKKCAASKFLGLGLFTFCVSETSVSARHVLTDGDRLAGLQFFSCETAPFPGYGNGSAHTCARARMLG
jgi:hypothetical protein